MTETARASSKVERGELASYYKVGDIVIHYAASGRKKVGIVHNIEPRNIVQVRFWIESERLLARMPTRVLPYRIVRIGRLG